MQSPSSQSGSRPAAVATPTLIVLAGSAVALAGTLLVRAVMARALEPAGLGLLIIAIALATAIGGVANIGINPATALRVADGLRRGDDSAARRSARSALAIGAVAGLVAGLVIFLSADLLALWFASRPEDRQPLAATLRTLTPVSLLMPLGGAALGVYRGHGRAAARALIRDGGGGLGRALGVAIAAVTVGSLSSLGLGYSAGVIAAEGGFVLEVVRRGWFRRPDEARSTGSVAHAAPSWDGELLRKLPSFAGIEVLTQGRMWLDLLILSLLASPAVVGFYGLARGLSRGLEVVFQAGVHRYLPALGVLDQATRPDLAARTRRLVLGLLMIPLAVGIMAPEVPILLLAGARYLASAPMLRILALAVLVDALFGYQDQTLLALGRSRAAVTIDLGALLVYGSLLWMLVPTAGARGAALALVGTTLARAIALAILLRGTALAGWPPTLGTVAAVGCLMIGMAVVQIAEPGPWVAGALASATGLIGIALLLRDDRPQRPRHRA